MPNIQQQCATGLTLSNGYLQAVRVTSGPNGGQNRYGAFFVFPG